MNYFSESFMRKSILGSSILFCVFVVCLLGGCHYFNQKLGLDDDNIFEETIEFIVDEKVGIDLDLTPNSPEK